MLVIFTCKAHSDITIFHDAAKRLLTMMGYSGVMPSTISAKDVPSALNRLKSAIEIAQTTLTPDRSMEAQPDESNQQTVSLKHRAWYLIELLTAAEKENCNVTWALKQKSTSTSLKYQNSEILSSA